jgi:hypothetical protein
MRALRPVVVLGTVASALVLWFVLRMAVGADPTVWRTSCLLGAWSPLLGAALLLYVRAIADREHSVGVAWLVRAIGMHCVLLWMVGVGDLLGGPPGDARRWLADAGAPLVLLGFVPVFALAFGALAWVRSIALRIPHSFLRPRMPDEREEVTAFRGVPLVRERVLSTPAPRAAYVIGALSLVACAHAPSHALAIAVGSAMLFALASARNSRAFAPSVLALALSCFVAAASAAAGGLLNPWVLFALTPWLAVAAIASMLAPLEWTLRRRHALTRA